MNRSLLNKIKDSITINYDPYLSATGLASGSIGVALFLYEYSHFFKDTNSFEAAEALTRYSRIKIENDCGLLGLFEGASGLAWLIKYKSRLFQEDCDLSDFDDLLYTYIVDKNNNPSYELINGLVGIGIYAIEPDSRNIINIKLLTAVLDKLEDWAHMSPVGTSWRLPARLVPAWQRELSPEGIYNLGISHGITGVLAFLSILYSQNFNNLNSKIAFLYNSCFNWIVTNLSIAEAPIIPSFLDSDQRVIDLPMPPRWCYGELGAGFALIHASRSIHRFKEYSNMVNYLKNHLKNCNHTLNNSSLCHGSAGNYLVLERIYEITDDNFFYNLGEHYFSQLIQKIHEPNNLILTPPGLDHPEEPCHWNPGFLEGLSGVGLTILSRNQQQPGWLRLLLLS